MTDARRLAEALAANQVTALQMTQTALDAIAANDDRVRAFVTVDADRARAAAAEADARRAAGKTRGPLDGIPVAVKDNIAVAHLPRHGGTRAFGRPRNTDATVTARLRAAGAVVLGTLNMHEGALGATTDNPFWGRCDNPAAPGHTPGGSSGGSAAAIAASYVPITLGSDTMGSVRIPAAYCGLWGLKPTRGLIPVTGLLHLSWTLDTIGPLAGTPEDLALALDLLAGLDEADPASVPANLRPARDLRGAILAVPSDTILSASTQEVQAIFADTCKAARTAGARLVPFALDWDPGPLRRAGLLVSEAEAAVILGTRIDDAPEAFSENFRAAVAYGRTAGAPRLAKAYRHLMQTASLALRAMASVDAVLMPTAPQRAFAHDAPVPANQADFTALANVAGLPALSVPLAAPGGGPPFAAQLMGPPMSDAALIAMGRGLREAATR